MENPTTISRSTRSLFKTVKRMVVASRYARQAKLDDGMFDICYAAPPLSKFEAVRLFMKAKDGKHTNDPHIHFLAGKDIKITFKDIVPAQVDGEPIPAYEYDISLIPEALSVLELKSATK